MLVENQVHNVHFTNMKKSLVIGASEKTERYANKAIRSLLSHGHEVIALGKRKGEVLHVPILTDKTAIQTTDLDTVTLYISAKYQAEYIDWILVQKPKRVIFNPGTENAIFAEKLKTAGVEAIEACTLVLLATNLY